MTCVHCGALDCAEVTPDLVANHLRSLATVLLLCADEVARRTDTGETFRSVVDVRVRIASALAHLDVVAYPLVVYRLTRAADDLSGAPSDPSAWRSAAFYLTHASNLLSPRMSN